MKRVFTFFLNKIVISILGLIVISLLIWFVGPEIKFGGANTAPLAGTVARLLTIMIVIVIWGLNNLRLALLDKKNNNGLVADLQQGDLDSKSLITEQTSEEINTINQRFSQALATLKKLKFTGAGSRKALYELPWYIIIGPPGSGKTTALVNSSLEFPLAAKFGKEALHGIGGTRNCDWWFTNEAVLIDTAGRYTTQDSHKVIDSSSWDGFLGLLKKYRRRRPINGAIVAISLQELLMQTEEERMAHARMIRARIDELMTKLEIRFPIYLMFTKTDLVSGFSEFFEDINKNDREQVWGISLPNSPGISQSPDFDYIQNEYIHLIERLNASVISRIHQERDVNRRGIIQGFPQQMESIKDILLQFVQQVFVKNRYQYQPYLRGIYFTSATQDGTPIDRLMSSVSANFGFARQGVRTGLSMGKSFFLGKLFREVIFPESELVGSSRKYEAMMRWSQRATFIGLTVIIVTMLTVWAASFTRNEMYLHEVSQDVSDYKLKLKQVNQWSVDLPAILPSLNALKKASFVYDKDAHPWLSGLGMYDSSVDDAANKAYDMKLRTLFLPRLLKYMEHYLRSSHRDKELYDNFRIYMMFNKIDHMNKKQITKWFYSHWDAEYATNESIKDNLKAHLATLLNLNVKPANLNIPLVDSVRAQLRQVPIAQRIYNRIRTNPEYMTKVNLIDEFGESVRAGYLIKTTKAHNLTIPFLFTIQGYKSIDLSKKSLIIEKFAQENWVLYDDGTSRHAFSDEELESISNKVKQYYYSEYINTWMSVYRSLLIRPFQNLRQANDMLLSFVDPVYSPLLSILHVGATNTTLVAPVVANLERSGKEGGKGKALSFIASHIRFTPVDKQFRQLNHYVSESKNSPAQIQRLISKIRQMEEFINGILLAPNPQKKSYEIAKARYQSSAGNPITSLLTAAKDSPEPVSRWMSSLTSETWKVLLVSAHSYINTQWHEQVYSTCTNALANRYPLNRNSSDDIGMLDFTEFFKPGGTIDKFVRDYVKPFVDVNAGWKNIGIERYNMGFSSATLSGLRNAMVIKNVFFRENPAVPTLTYQLKPYNMPKTDERFSLELGNKRISYSHGPKFWSTLKWTGSDENSRVRLVFEDLAGNQHTTSYEGPWAWFRLKDHSKIEKSSSSNIFYITYDVKDEDIRKPGVNHKTSGHTIGYEIKPKSVKNAFSKDILNTFKCSGKI